MPAIRCPPHTAALHIPPSTVIRCHPLTSATVSAAIRRRHPPPSAAIRRCPPLPSAAALRRRLRRPPPPSADTRPPHSCLQSSSTHSPPFHLPSRPSPVPSPSHIPPFNPHSCPVPSQSRLSPFNLPRQTCADPEAICPRLRDVPQRVVVPCTSRPEPRWPAAPRKSGAPCPSYTLPCPARGFLCQCCWCRRGHDAPSHRGTARRKRRRRREHVLHPLLVLAGLRGGRIHPLVRVLTRFSAFARRLPSRPPIPRRMPGRHFMCTPNLRYGKLILPPYTQNYCVS